MQDKSLVGIGLGITKGDKIEYMQGYGYADKEQKKPIDCKKTLFRWASMSKQITSIIAMNLYEQGKLDLDEDITKYIDYYIKPNEYLKQCDECTKGYTIEKIPYQYNITMRMLLAHFSGLQQYDNGVGTAIPPNILINNKQTNLGIEWAIQSFIGNPLISLPGKYYNYTTQGFQLAGLVLEKVTGVSFESLTKIFVSEKAEMNTLVPDRAWEALFRPQRAKGYINYTQIQEENDVSFKLPGGGFMSSVEDLCKFSIGLRKELFISENMKDQAWKYYHESEKGYGLGFQIRYFDKNSKVLSIGHSGSQEKVKSELRYYPLFDFSIVFFSNSEDMNNREFLKGLEDILLGNVIQEA